MEIIEKLPDDIVLYIYTKILKRYRVSKEGTLIKLINLEKYSFLEKCVCRRAVSICKSYYSDLPETYPSGNMYRIQYSIPNVSEIVNRRESYIDNDMICIELIEHENSLQFEFSRYQLKRLENIRGEKKRSIYHIGDLVDYDWEVFSYSYTI